MDYTKWKTHSDYFRKDKPLKYIYPNQRKVKAKFILFILPYLKADLFFKKVWIWGSLEKGTFGVYAQHYRGQEGSDVDLLVEVDETKEIPTWFKEIKDWTATRTYSRAFSSTLIFKNQISLFKSIKHKVDFICHFPSVHSKEKFYGKVKESQLIYEKQF